MGRLLPTSKYRPDLGAWLPALSRVFSSYKSTWTRTGFLEFCLFWIEGRPLTSTSEFGTRTPGGGALCLPFGSGAGPSGTAAPASSPSRHLPSPESRWRGPGTPCRAGASLPGSCLARPRRALGEGGQAAVWAVPVALVTGSGRAPRGPRPRGKRGTDGPRARAGRTGRERRGRRRSASLPSGRRAAALGAATPSPAAAGACECPPSGPGRAGRRRRRPRRGGRAGGRRRREGPPRVPGEPARVSQLPVPAPTAGLASGRGGAGGPARAAQSFQRHFQRVGSEPRAAEPGRRAGLTPEAKPATDTEPAASETGPGCRQPGAEIRAPQAERPSGPSSGPAVPGESDFVLA